MAAAFGYKIPKSRQGEKTPYTIFYHGMGKISDSSLATVAKRCWKEDFIQFVSMDPSRKHFGFRIERRYNSGHISTLEMTKEDVSGTKDGLPDENMFMETYLKVSTFLSTYSAYYPHTHVVVIERQLPQNYPAVRIAQHAISYFLEHRRALSPHSIIMEMDSKCKTKMLGAPKGLNQNQVKKWSVDHGYDLLSLRGDVVGINILDNFKKKKHKLDDMADTINQIEALCKLWDLPPTQELLLHRTPSAIFRISPPQDTSLEE